MVSGASRIRFISLRAMEHDLSNPQHEVCPDGDTRWYFQLGGGPKMKLLIQGVIICLMLAVLLPSGIASAQEPVPNLSKMDAAQRERVKSTGRAPLVIDCKRMRRGTAKQRRLAKKHCERRDSRSQSVSGAISPTDTTVRHGNCGTTLIAVENVGGGTARIRAGANSILGPIL